METKKKQTLVRILLLLGIIVVLNFISVRIFGRIDLTKNNLYSLSDASKNLMENLDDKITIKAYFTENLPAPYNNNRRVLLDMLNEYKAYAGGNLQLEFISPEDEDGKQNAQKNGIPPVQIQVVNNDKLEVKKAYMGLVIRYEDKKETIPILQNLGSLEYDLSGIFKRLTQKSKKKIGYTKGHGELTLDNIKQSVQELQKQYDFVPVDLSSSTTIGNNIDILLMINPTQKFDEPAKIAIDQYLMNGGKLALFINKIKIDPSFKNLQGEPMDLGLYDLFRNWGFSIRKAMVRDNQCASISVQQQQGGFSIRSQVAYPYLVKVTNFNKDNMIVKDLQTVVFQFPSPVDTLGCAEKGIKADILASTSKQSGIESSNFKLNPFQKFSMREMSMRSIPLAAIFSGSFKSHYYGKSDLAKLKKSPETRIAVVGCGMIVRDGFIMTADSKVFFANILDYLSDDAGLITIRSKNVSQPQLEELSDGTRKFIKCIDMFLPPLIILLIGFFRWRRKVTIKKSIEAQL